MDLCPTGQILRYQVYMCILRHKMMCILKCKVFIDLYSYVGSNSISMEVNAEMDQKAYISYLVNSLVYGFISYGCLFAIFSEFCFPLIGVFDMSDFIFEYSNMHRSVYSSMNKIWHDFFLILS